MNEWHGTQNGTMANGKMANGEWGMEKERNGTMAKWQNGEWQMGNGKGEEWKRRGMENLKERKMKGMGMESNGMELLYILKDTYTTHHTTITLYTLYYLYLFMLGERECLNGC